MSKHKRGGPNGNVKLSSRLTADGRVVYAAYNRAKQACRARSNKALAARMGMSESELNRYKNEYGLDTSHLKPFRVRLSRNTNGRPSVTTAYCPLGDDEVTLLPRAYNRGAMRVTQQGGGDQGYDFLSSFINTKRATKRLTHDQLIPDAQAAAIKRRYRKLVGGTLSADMLREGLRQGHNKFLRYTQLQRMAQTGSVVGFPRKYGGHLSNPPIFVMIRVAGRLVALSPSIHGTPPAGTVNTLLIRPPPVRSPR